MRFTKEEFEKRWAAVEQAWQSAPPPEADPENPHRTHCRVLGGDLKLRTRPIRRQSPKALPELAVEVLARLGETDGPLNVKEVFPDPRPNDLRYAVQRLSYFGYAESEGSWWVRATEVGRRFLRGNSPVDPGGQGGIPKALRDDPPEYVVLLDQQYLGTQICRRCGQTLSLEEFPITRGGFRETCRACLSGQGKLAAAETVERKLLASFRRKQILACRGYPIVG